MFLLCLAAILAGIVPSPGGIFRSGHYDHQPSAITQISLLGTALAAFEEDNGYFPRGTNGLLFLMQRPPGATNWHGPYLGRFVPKDPWGHDYIYECPGRHNAQSYDLSSMGPDGQAGGRDDICNWKQN